MEQTHDTRWERSLEQVARRFDYPPTPPLADAVRRRPTTDGRPPTADTPSGDGRPSAVGRRLAWALLLVAFAAALLAAPRTRAVVLAFFARVGAIEIFVDEAARRLGFAPRRPAALGEPDEVYLHRDVDLPAVTLVWRGPDGAPLSLTQIGVAEFARKIIGEGSIEETTVNGATAIWLPGPHTLLLFGDWQPNAIPITSNVLIWTGDGFTFRLEGDVTLEEAVAVAESVGE